MESARLIAIPQLEKLLNETATTLNDYAKTLDEILKNPKEKEINDLKDKFDGLSDHMVYVFETLFQHLQIHKNEKIIVKIISSNLRVLQALIYALTKRFSELNRLDIILQLNENLYKAIKAFRKILNDTKTESETINTFSYILLSQIAVIGDYHLKHENYLGAFRYLEKGLDIINKINFFNDVFKESKASFVFNIAIVHTKLGNANSAEMYLVEYAKLVKEIEKPADKCQRNYRYKKACVNLAELFYKNNEYQKAVHWYSICHNAQIDMTGISADSIEKFKQEIEPINKKIKENFSKAKKEHLVQINKIIDRESNANTRCFQYIDISLSKDEKWISLNINSKIDIHPFLSQLPKQKWRVQEDNLHKTVQIDVLSISENEFESILKRIENESSHLVNTKKRRELEIENAKKSRELDKAKEKEREDQLAKEISKRQAEKKPIPPEPTTKTDIENEEKTCVRPKKQKKHSTQQTHQEVAPLKVIDEKNQPDKSKPELTIESLGFSAKWSGYKVYPLNWGGIQCYGIYIPDPKVADAKVHEQHERLLEKGEIKPGKSIIPVCNIPVTIREEQKEVSNSSALQEISVFKTKIRSSGKSHSVASSYRVFGTTKEIVGKNILIVFNTPVHHDQQDRMTKYGDKIIKKLFSR